MQRTKWYEDWKVVVRRRTIKGNLMGWSARVFVGTTIVYEVDNVQVLTAEEASDFIFSRFYKLECEAAHEELEAKYKDEPWWNKRPSSKNKP